MNIPIIILASERSGSNLLRTLLGKHKEICAPVAPHLMIEFYNSRKYYGDLRQTVNSSSLIEDMLLLANHPFSGWKLNCDIKKIAGDVNSIVGAFDILFSEKSRQEGKIHYCSKGISSFDFIDPFRSELENVKFIHLVRDPRDHVASWMRRPIHIYTPYDAIIKWKSEQECLIDAIKTRGLECISIKYEDLISNTRKVMSEILDYIGVEIDFSCFSTDHKNKESYRNPYWENLSKPIMSDNKGKFRMGLSDEDVLIIESIAKNEMKYFEYECCTAANWEPEENYHVKLEHMRKTKKKAGSKDIRNNMADLTSRWQLAKIIRNKRRDEWLNKNFAHEKYLNIRPNNNSSIIYTGTVFNRMRLMSYGLLGLQETNLVRKKIIAFLSLTDEK